MRRRGCLPCPANAGIVGMRRLTPTIVLAGIGLVAGGIYRYFADDPGEATLANYLRSSFHGMGVALSGWAVHLYFTSRSSGWVTKWPLVIELLVKSIITAVVVAAVAMSLQVALYGNRIESTWLGASFPLIVGIAFVMSMLISSAYELIRLVGGRVLLSVMLGRYRRPRRESACYCFSILWARRHWPSRWVSCEYRSFSPDSSST
jgi:hypothetical protein